MKILHINCNYIGTALHRIMVKELNSPNIEITVFAPVQDNKTTDVVRLHDNEIVSKCFKKIDRLLFFAKQNKILHSLENRVKNIDQFDVIHAFTLLTDGNVAYRLNKKYGIPYVVAIRDTDINAFFRLKPYLRPLGIKIMRRASAVIFLSDSYKELVLNKYVSQRYRTEINTKIYVIPNGIDQFWIENKYIQRDYESIEKRLLMKQLSVLCVGRINKRKNIPFVQSALNILRKKNWNVFLNVVGQIEDQAEYRKIIRDKYTTYFPSLDKENLIDYYRKADIFILISHTETFGLVYAEAMSQGLPVLYTKGQGFDGQFHDGEVGYAVSDFDINETATMIEKVCNKYSRISKNAMLLADKFNWKDICNCYQNIYRGIKNERD